MQFRMKAAILVSLMLAQTAFAERYLVIMKDKNVFNQTHQQVLAGARNLGDIQIQSVSGAGVVTPFSKAGVQVQGSLEHIQSVVIDADNMSQIEELKKSGLVALVEKEIFHPSPRPVQGYVRTQAWSYDLTRTVSAKSILSSNTPWGILAVNAPQVWSQGNKGQASRVMVLDTGIDKDHPALKDNFEKGRDFTGEGGSPYPFVDVVGHGTHCSGTIAGVELGDGFSGVAPQAKLLMGRVCGEQGCSNIAVAAGMNWAIDEKVDVVSMSLGGPAPTAAERRAAEAVAKAGISIVAASGNDGTNKISYPGAFPTVVAVGAIDNTLTKAKFSQWGPELAIVAPGVDVISSVPQGTGRESKVNLNSKSVLSSTFSGSPEVKVAISNDLVVSGLGKPGDFTSAVKGKFALISRGEIAFGDKVKNAIAAGAAGVVVYNNEPGLLQGALTQDGSIVAIPVVMVEQTSGLQAKALLDQGQNVSASMQTIATDYASFAGTSMATPHVAGVVALMRTANKNLTPAQVKSILKSTATPKQPNTQNEYGSGIVNAQKAVQASMALKEAPPR